MHNLSAFLTFQGKRWDEGGRLGRRGDVPITTGVLFGYILEIGLGSAQTFLNHIDSSSMGVQRKIDLGEPGFLYFAYGSCMCPVDLKRSLGEDTHQYVVGPAWLEGYRLGFFRRSPHRGCGVLDIIPTTDGGMEGVLYYLPLRLSARLDQREEVHTGGYQHHQIAVDCCGQRYESVRTYVVVDKLTQEVAPNDWYFNVVMRGAVTCGLSDQYCWQLFNRMHWLQDQQCQAS